MKIALKTDIGQKRSSNQDYVNKFANQAGQVLIVLADGMGGHKAGHIASEETVTDLGRSWIDTAFREGDWESIRSWLIDTIQAANRRIYEMGQNEDYQGMGTTVEAVALIGNHAVFAHVGDSRISLIRSGHYQLLTSDHSLVNALVRAGQLTEEEAANHPQKNIILQSVGQEDPLDIDLGLQELIAGDYLLINSDGLTNMVNQSMIVDVVTAATDLDDKAERLVAEANLAGGLDNISLALVHLESEAGRC